MHVSFLQCQVMVMVMVVMVGFVEGLVTLETIRDLTGLMDELRVRIEEAGGGSGGLLGLGLGSERVLSSGGGGGGGDGGGREVVLSAGRDGDEGEEVEVVVAAALKVLCSELLAELEKPFIAPPVPIILETDQAQNPEDLRCRVIRRGYHKFLESTVKFLHEIQERQMQWRFDHESAVFDGVGWLQGLWASRRMNIQERSFIEQQMMLYGDTGCFGKSQEVLRSGVEVVEYLNDLLDEFP
ncbi:hypothetical protein EG329_000391 [Mollisiaceae sp. DMI_Dod_QoI]|nr:hypothetical protein EG329_000391 [Helotiales sp. DMI_Dod_QoI]